MKTELLNNHDEYVINQLMDIIADNIEDEITEIKLKYDDDEIHEEEFYKVHMYNLYTKDYKRYLKLVEAKHTPDITHVELGIHHLFKDDEVILRTDVCNVIKEEQDEEGYDA